MEEKQGLAIVIKARDEASATLKKIQDETDKVASTTSSTGKTASKAMADFGKNLDNIGEKAMATGKALTAGLTLPIVGLATYGVKAYSDLGEATNAANVTFGKASQKLIEYSKTAATQVGLSQRAFLQAGVPIGAMLQNVGLSADKAANYTVDLTKRAADMASVFNTDVNDALAAITAGLRGEADPLERYGVGLSETAINAYALSKGISKTGKDLTAQEKTLARLGLLFEQTNRLQGDFVNTSDGLANAQRIARAEMENSAATLGGKLYPYATKLMKAVSGLIDRFNGLTDSQQNTLLKTMAYAALIGPLTIALGGLAKAIAFVITTWSTGLTMATKVNLALAAMTVAAILIYENWDKIVSVTQKVIGVFKGLGEIVRVIATGDFRGGIFGIQEDAPFISALITFHEKLESVANYVKSAFSSAMQAGEKAINWIKDAFEKGKQSIIDHKRELEVLEGFLAVVFGPAMVKLGISVAKIAAGMALDAAKAAGAWILNLGKMAIESAISAGKMAINAVIAGAAWVLESAKASAAWVLNFAKMVLQAGISALQMGASAAIAGYGWIWESVKALAAWTLNLGKILLQMIINAPKMALEGVKAAASWIGSSAIALGEWLLNLPKMLAAMAINSVKMAIEGAKAAAGWVAGAVATAFQWAVSFAAMAMGAMSTAATMLVAGMRSAAAWLLALGPIGLIIAAVAAVAVGVYLVIRYWDQIKEFFVKLFGNIGRTINDFAGGLWQSGKDMVAGLVKGLAGSAESVYNKIIEICKGALDKVKKFFGISSPSKVMATQGKWLMEGLGMGIEKNAGIAKSAMLDASANLASGLNFSSNPSIDATLTSDRPVDLSSVAIPTAPITPTPLEETTTSASPQVVQQVTIQNVIGTASGLRDLAVTLAQLAEEAMQGQGVTSVTELRTT